jgi:hypothetical protein
MHVLSRLFYPLDVIQRCIFSNKCLKPLFKSHPTIKITMESRQRDAWRIYFRTFAVGSGFWSCSGGLCKTSERLNLTTVKGINIYQPFLHLLGIYRLEQMRGLFSCTSVSSFSLRINTSYCLGSNSSIDVLTPTNSISINSSWFVAILNVVIILWTV